MKVYGTLKKASTHTTQNLNSFPQPQVASVSWYTRNCSGLTFLVAVKVPIGVMLPSRLLWCALGGSLVGHADKNRY